MAIGHEKGYEMVGSGVVNTFWKEIKALSYGMDLPYDILL